MHRILVLIVLAAVPLVAAERGFKSLFNGKTLAGWDGDPRLWKVERGEIVGSTEGVQLTGNTFLIGKNNYEDFELRLEIKLRNHNSGVQFRSEVADPANWVVKGLQADAAEGNWWGSIYDERGKRGVIVDGWKGKGETVVKANDWNEMRIYARGGDIRITLNGMVTAELTGETPVAGILALQLHRGPAMEARFRNIRIRELK